MSYEILKYDGYYSITFGFGEVKMFNLTKKKINKFLIDLDDGHTGQLRFLTEDGEEGLFDFVDQHIDIFIGKDKYICTIRYEYIITSAQC